MMLQESFRAIEQQMKAKLAEVRVTFGHSGIKGTQIEAIFREFLRSYLARRLSIGHGEIVDTSGARSGQVDIVVAEDDHPFTFTQEQPGLFFIEGICAAGEVKSVLTSEELRRTIENSHKFKALRVQELNGSLSFTCPEDQVRFYDHRPFFLIAMESQLTLKAVAQAVSDSGGFASPKNKKILDAVFILDRGWLIDLGRGEGSYKIMPNGVSQPGWVAYESNQVLVDFMTWLSVSMPRVVRFQSILTNYLLSGERSST